MVAKEQHYIQNMHCLYSRRSEGRVAVSALGHLPDAIILFYGGFKLPSYPYSSGFLPRHWDIAGKVTLKDMGKPAGSKPN